MRLGGHGNASCPPLTIKTLFILWLACQRHVYSSVLCQACLSRSLVWSKVKQALEALHFSPLCLLKLSASKLVICTLPPVKCLSLKLLAGMNHPCYICADLIILTFDTQWGLRCCSMFVYEAQSVQCHTICYYSVALWCSWSHIWFKLKLLFSGGGMLAHLPAETVCCWTVSKVCCTTGLWATLACPFVGLSGSRVEAQGSAQAHTSICWKISAKSLPNRVWRFCVATPWEIKEYILFKWCLILYWSPTHLLFKSPVRKWQPGKRKRG